MIIDNTYFIEGICTIPNSVMNESITGKVPTTVAKINSYVDQYEKELLINALGNTNYEALKTAYEADPTLSGSANEKWRDLVTGKEYTYEGSTVVWNGLQELNGTAKESLIANYVFSFYLTDDFQNYTSTGVQVEKAKNAMNVSPDFRLVRVWREFIQKYQYGYDVCPKRISNSWGVRGVDFYNKQQNTIRSLYQFLRDNDNYGTYVFKTYRNRNVMGI